MNQVTIGGDRSGERRSYISRIGRYFTPLALVVALALGGYAAFGPSQSDGVPGLTFADHSGRSVSALSVGGGLAIEGVRTPTFSLDAPIVALPSIADLAERVKPSVVSVDVETRIRSWYGTRIAKGSGSGVIFSEDGYVLTNNHVIEDAFRANIVMADGRTLPARLVGADSSHDLAVLKVDAKGLPAAPLSDNTDIRVGDWVVAIGNALSLPGEHSVTLGVVSALGRTLDDPDGGLSDLIQTDAVINPGNSGGPLLNLNGEVVGINTAVLRGGSVEGIGFAVSTNTVIPVVEGLVASYTAARA